MIGKDETLNKIIPFADALKGNVHLPTTIRLTDSSMLTLSFRDDGALFILFYMVLKTAVILCRIIVVDAQKSSPRVPFIPSSSTYNIEPLRQRVASQAASTLYNTIEDLSSLGRF